MQDDVDTFLLLKPRLKEWMPELPGLHKLSKSETQVDIDQIIANIHQTPSQAQQLAFNIGQPDPAGEREGKQRSKAAKEKNKGKEAKEASASAQPIDAADDSGGADRRRRLQEKIQSSRDVLQADHVKASSLRLELDQLRNEILSYEDAIMQAKREIESAKRERREEELQYNALRAEYELQLHKLELSRLDAEQTEAELRQRLTKSSAENHDLSERLNQLRQLEDEFKMKDAKIEVLQIQNTHGHRKLAMYEGASKAVQQVTPTVQLMHTMTQVLNAITQEQLGPYGPQPQSDTPTGASGSGSTSSSSHPFSSSLFSMMEEHHLTAEFRDAIRHFLDRMASLERNKKLVEEESNDKSVIIVENNRSIRSLIAQLERSTTVHAELNLQMRQMELAFQEESAKTESSLNTIQLLQKQKNDQQTLLLGYEERMKHFQQLLTAADVRADSANNFLAELLKQWNVLKYGTRQLQETINRMREEMRKLVKERNDAYDELHDKVVKYSTSLLNNNSNNPLTPPSLPQQHSSSPHSLLDKYWIEKDRRLEQHYKTLSEENLKLKVDVSELQQQIQEKEAREKNFISRSQHEENIQSLALTIDECKRNVLQAQRGVEEASRARGEAEAQRAALEAELKALKAEKDEREAKEVSYKAAIVKTEDRASSLSPVLADDKEDERQAKKRKLENGANEQNAAATTIAPTTAAVPNADTSPTLSSNTSDSSDVTMTQAPPSSAVPEAPTPAATSTDATQ